MRVLITIAFAVNTLGAISAVAEKAKRELRGTAGAIAVPFAAANAGAKRMTCSATVAHWFSVDLGEADPGEAVEATLWLVPGDGEISLLNASEDRMPVQALWCGLAGRSWQTRSPVPLARRAGAAPDPIDLTCVPEGERLRCR